MAITTLGGRRLLVSTLYAWLLVVFIHVVVTMMTVGSPPDIRLSEYNLFSENALGHLVHRLSRWKCLLEEGKCCGIESFGEFDGECHIEVSRFMVAQRWHTLTGNHFQITVLNDFSRHYCNHESAVVEMLDDKLASSERSEEVKLNLINEIVILALESVMRLLLHNDHHVSWLSAWCLITFPSKGDGLAILHSFVDVDLQKFLLWYRLLAFASSAPVASVDDFSGPRTLVTGGLHLLNHGTHLTQSNADTTSIASMTSLDSTVLAALSFTFRADNVSSESELGDFALVEVLEGDIDAMDEILGPARSLVPSSPSTAAKETPATTSKELAEQIMRIHSAAKATLF